MRFRNRVYTHFIKRKPSPSKPEALTERAEIHRSAAAAVVAHQADNIQEDVDEVQIQGQRAFKRYMEAAQADKPAKDFYYDDSVVQKQFSTSTGAIVSGGGETGYYTEDNLPDDSYATLTDPSVNTLDPAAG